MSVRIEHDRLGVTTIIVDRAAKMNAMDSATLTALAEAADAVGADPAVRAVVLRGAGERAFIGGADVNEMAALSGPGAARAFITRVHHACAALRRIPVPVIACIQGYTLGAGLEIAASCDLRVASRLAVFGMPEVRIGLPSVVEAALLPLLIGWGRTRWLLLTGETIDAAQAYAWGLVEQLAEPTELDATVARTLEGIVAAGAAAIRLQKRLIGAWETVPLQEAVRSGIACFETAWHSDEPRRMLAAHLTAMRARKTRG